MPYIKMDRRKQLEPILKMLSEYEVKADGDLNYILFKYCKYYVKPSYNNYKNFCGELNQCVTEIERRILAPYEDEKIKENGEV